MVQKTWIFSRVEVGGLDGGESGQGRVLINHFDSTHTYTYIYTHTHTHIYTHNTHIYTHNTHTLLHT